MNKPAYFPSDSSEPARAKSESQRSFESKPQDPKWKHFVHVPDPILFLSLSFFFTRSESGQIDRDSRHTRYTQVSGSLQRFDPILLVSHRFRLPRIRIPWIYVHFDSLVVGVNHTSSSSSSQARIRLRFFLFFFDRCVAYRRFLSIAKSHQPKVSFDSARYPVFEESPPSPSSRYVSRVYECTSRGIVHLTMESNDASSSRGRRFFSKNRRFSAWIWWIQGGRANFNDRVGKIGRNEIAFFGGKVIAQKRNALN